MGERIKLLIISILFGVILALVMLFAGETALGEFLRSKSKIIILIFAIIIVVIWESPKFLKK